MYAYKNNGIVFELLFKVGEDGKVLKLSEADPDYKSIIDKERKRLENGIRIDLKA